MDKIWPVISNTEVIAVNQAYVGHSGSAFKKSVDTVTLGDIDYSAVEKGAEYSTVGKMETASFQYLYKPTKYDAKWQGGGVTETAVLLMNSDTTAQDLTVNFADIPSVDTTKSGTWTVRDIWNHKDVALVRTGNYTAKAVGPHDAAFIMVIAH
jgi:hypothetical protein